jgi:hypothetical protein
MARCEETTMWLIELNVAGHRFSHLVAEKRWQLFRLRGRALPRRATQLRQSRAA